LLRAAAARGKRASDRPQVAPATSEPARSAALTLQQPIRGGQVIYAENADAIALSSVNAGGELIADGNVHIYGALRGRALAGAHGDANARIFCHSLEAELLSIAGVYLSADELPDARRGKPAQVYLDGESLVITELVHPTSAHT
jgi:septum site-determining protein MinC